MILEAAISNICHRIDLLTRPDAKGPCAANVSSNTRLKQEFVACLTGLIKAAPDAEYEHLFASEQSQVVLGYLVHVLCKLATNEKSRPLRIESLQLLLVLLERLESLHRSQSVAYKGTPVGLRCCLNLVSSALPGVSSAMFKLLMSDTKIPAQLLVASTRVLAHIIRLAFLPDCKQHQSIYSDAKILQDTCENLSLRIQLLINYVTFHGHQLALDVKVEVLNLCETLLHLDCSELLAKVVNAIVKYIAFLSSNHSSASPEVDLKVASISDAIKNNSQHDCDEALLSCLSKLLDNLDEFCLSMLSSERHAQLSTLLGYIRLLNSSSLTTLLEIESRRNQLFQILFRLCEFDVQQPLLFVADKPIDSNALENYGKQIYTTEKRFVHIESDEIDLIRQCCSSIGQNLDWELLVDIFRSELRHLASPNILYVTQQVLAGFLFRNEHDLKANERKVCRFTVQNIDYYLDQIRDLYALLKRAVHFNPSPVCCAEQVLKIVISIETLVTLVEIHLRFCRENSRRIIILRSLLCPVLGWCSSDYRAISEAALSGLIKISHLYGHASIKSLIEDHVDYIVDGIGRMLDSYMDNIEVASVLAISFKLSSIETFYYFRDIYERVFRSLGTYQHCVEECKPIILLFYRTLMILNEWKQSRSSDDGKTSGARGVPLKDANTLNSVAHEISIRRRIRELERKLEHESSDNECQEKADVKTREKEVLDGIKSGRSGEHLHKGDDKDNEPKEEDEAGTKKEKPTDVILAEKIVSNCINWISSQDSDVRILAMQAVSEGFKVLSDDEDTLLPLVHQTWAPLIHRLTGDYSNENLEVNLCAFECLLSMAYSAKDFIKRRTLDTIIPRVCLFLESQAKFSNGMREYEPYCLSLAYKCQLRILTHLGALAYFIQLGYDSLWRVIKSALIYLDPKQVTALQEAARTSLHYLLALDPDCVWFYAKQVNQLDNIPFDLFYENKAART